MQDHVCRLDAFALAGRERLCETCHVDDCLQILTDTGELLRRLNENSARRRELVGRCLFNAVFVDGCAVALKRAVVVALAVDECLVRL